MNGWQWRHSLNAWPNDRFHAYDGDDHAACSPSSGLFQSTHEVTEGDELCPECMAIVRTNRAEPEAEMRSPADPGRYRHWRSTGAVCIDAPSVTVLRVAATPEGLADATAAGRRQPNREDDA